MIKINDKYSYERGVDCWILRKAVAKKEESKVQTYVRTYHSTLEQLYTKLLSDTAVGAESVAEVITGFHAAKSKILKAIEREEGRL